MSILGSSPLTTIMGYLMAGIITAYQLIQSGGIPQDTQGWLMIAGAGVSAAWGRFQKDHNVSNAPAPSPEGTQVKP